jgi:DNA-binding HxlR family transcriptional regulator
VATPRHIDVTARGAQRADERAAPHPQGLEIERHLRENAGIATQNCQPIAEVLARVGDKWTALVVMLLGNGPKRFNELRRLIGTISQRMLTMTLRALERDGIVTREVFPTIPPRVDYELTPLGRSLLEPIAALTDWAYAHRGQMAQAREDFDRRASEPAQPRADRTVHRISDRPATRATSQSAAPSQPLTRRA